MPKHKPRKIVAAGWYVGAGLMLLLAAIPPAWFNSYARVTLGVLGIACLLGAGYEWRFRREPSDVLRLFFDARRYAELPERTRGVIGVFDLSVGDPGHIGSTGHLFSADHDRELNLGKRKGDAIRCEITNFSTVPLASVQVVFRVTINRSVRSANLDIPGGNQYSAGEVIRSADWDIGINMLLPGEENKGVFYIRNMRDVFMTVTLPAVATAELLEDPKRFRVRLPTVQYRDVLLFPCPDSNSE